MGVEKKCDFGPPLHVTLNYWIFEFLIEKSVNPFLGLGGFFFSSNLGFFGSKCHEIVHITLSDPCPSFILTLVNYHTTLLIWERWVIDYYHIRKLRGKPWGLNECCVGYYMKSSIIDELHCKDALLNLVYFVISHSNYGHHKWNESR